MDSRERYRAVTHYQPFDRLFRHEMRAYPETVKRWQREGLALDDDYRRIAGYDRFETAPVRVGLAYGFDYETLELTDEYEIYRDSREGAIKKKLRNAPPPAMPQYLEFPLKDRETWREVYLPRLDPESPCRIPMHWESLKKQYAARDFPLGVHAGSIFGWIRDWMGVETIAVTLYDDPDFVKEMMDHLADLTVAVLGKVVFDVQFDFAVMWEDMAYKGGSLISPRHVRQLMLPNYRKVTDLLHKAGIDIVMLDSDGDVWELIPIWLDAGINYIYPMEVASGMDVVALRKTFGRDLRMGGGMDKRILARGDRKAIDAMVEAKRDLILEGGYVPGCDHAIPPDVPWESYLRYREKLAEIA
ncbi:MAG: uroporphyrinogen decarboxylase family protein [Candidatus Brocadiia bacterium]